MVTVWFDKWQKGWIQIFWATTMFICSWITFVRNYFFFFFFNTTDRSLTQSICSGVCPCSKTITCIIIIFVLPSQKWCVVNQATRGVVQQPTLIFGQQAAKQMEHVARARQWSLHQPGPTRLPGTAAGWRGSGELWCYSYHWCFESGCANAICGHLWRNPVSWRALQTRHWFYNTFE